MMQLENAIEELEAHVLKNEDPELESIYLKILSAFTELSSDLEKLQAEKEKISEDLEERKEIMWNNPMFRESVLSNIRQVIRS